MQLQVFVQDAAEAVRAVRTGAQGVVVDGHANPVMVRSVVARVRMLRDDVCISAPIWRPEVALSASAQGTVSTGPTASMLRLQVQQMAATGVDRVWVPVPSLPGQAVWLTQLGLMAREGVPVVPVVAVPAVQEPQPWWPQMQALLVSQGFEAVVLDVRGADGMGQGWREQRVMPAPLVGMVQLLRRRGVHTALLAEPRHSDLARLQPWAPDELVVSCWRRPPVGQAVQLDPRDRGGRTDRSDRLEARGFDEHQLDQWRQALQDLTREDARTEVVW